MIQFKHCGNKCLCSLSKPTGHACWHRQLSEFSKQADAVPCLAEWWQMCPWWMHGLLCFKLSFCLHIFLFRLELLTMCCIFFVDFPLDLDPSTVVHARQESTVWANWHSLSPVALSFFRTCHRWNNWRDGWPSLGSWQLDSNAAAAN